MLAKPDPKTFQLLPFRAGVPAGVRDDSAVARVFCDIFNLDGTPFEGCPRHVLRRGLEKARSRGFTFYAAPELEYFYFADSDSAHRPQPLDRGSYFELTVADLGHRPSQAHRAHPRGDGDPGRVRPARGRSRASTRSTCATPTP